MRWVTWNEAALVAVVCLALSVMLRRARPTRWGELALPAVNELGLLAGLYSLWRIARFLPLANDAGAIERARSIAELQDTLGLPSELVIQETALGNDALTWFANAYYAIVHVPATIAFLVWLFVRYRDHYRPWRTAIVIFTACSLVIRFQRVAPPRFLSDLGFVDLSRSEELFDVYGPIGTGVSDQFAAMPSIHVGWATALTFGLLVVGRSPSRWVIAPLHLLFTMYAVTATAHHWWLDGIVAAVLVGVGFAIGKQLDARPGRDEVAPARHTITT